MADEEETLYIVKKVKKAEIPEQSKKPTPASDLSSFTSLLFVATVFQAIVIGTFALGSPEDGAEPIARARIDGLIEAQNEFIRTLRIEVSRLKNRRPQPTSNSCTASVSQALDQLESQVDQRIRDYVKGEAKRLVSKGFRDRNMESDKNLESTSNYPDPMRRAGYCR